MQKAHTESVCARVLPAHTDHILILNFRVGDGGLSPDDRGCFSASWNVTFPFLKGQQRT